tara:strand:+ start:2740 stop:3033 length:294 start_codon:yes stop_codon:yes gene_type:complete
MEIGGIGNFLLIYSFFYHQLDSILFLRTTMGRIENHIFQVDEERCFGCAACIALCPVNALFLDDKLAVVEELECTHCEHCIPLCPVHALSIIEMVAA